MAGGGQASAPTFSAQTFAKLSPHPYMLASLNPTDSSIRSQRTNGRQPNQFRPVQVNFSPLTHTNGSATVRLGDTTVICGVRAETLPVTEIPNYRPYSSSYGPQTDEISSYDLLVPNIELATGSAPEFLPGVPPTPLAQTLSTRLYTLLLGSGMVQIDDLRIWQINEEDDDDGDKMNDDEGQEEEKERDFPNRTLRGYWVLYIDVTFASYDGNPFDAAWVAVLAALRDTRLPGSWWDTDLETIVCSPEEKKSRSLRLEGFPIACSATVFTERDKAESNVGKYWVLADPGRQEEKLCDESICMVVDCTEQGSTKMLHVSKHGGSVLDRELVHKFRKLAEKRWQECRTALV